MKKLVLLASVMVVPMLNANASETGPGCGVGTMIFSGKTGVANHLMAATTNDLVFGMSSVTTGTFGCDSTQQVMNENNRDRFVAHNVDSIAIDAAKGQGEYLAALAGIMGISDADKSAFFSLAQQNYDSIFVNTNSDATMVVSSLDKVLADDARFARYVR